MAAKRLRWELGLSPIGLGSDSLCVGQSGPLKSALRRPSMEPVGGLQVGPEPRWDSIAWPPAKLVTCRGNRAQGTPTARRPRAPHLRAGVAGAQDAGQPRPCDAGSDAAESSVRLFGAAFSSATPLGMRLANETLRPCDLSASSEVRNGGLAPSPVGPRGIRDARLHRYAVRRGVMSLRASWDQGKGPPPKGGA